jgi:hypothetical protein
MEEREKQGGSPQIYAESADEIEGAAVTADN